MNKKAFTLVEVLVVLGLSGILVTLVFSAYVDVIRQYRQRQLESAQFERMTVYQHYIRKKIHQNKIKQCQLGDIDMVGLHENQSLSIKTMLDKRFPEIQNPQFTCFFVDTISKEIKSWELGYPVDLIEYEWEGYQGSMLLLFR